MRRIWAVFFLLLVLYLTIIARLFYWQIIRGEELRLTAARQYGTTLNLPAARGQILSRDQSPLVINYPGYLIYADPQELTPGSASALSRVLAMDEASVSALLAREGRYVPLGHHLSAETVAAVRKLPLKGIGFEPEASRYYPEGSMAAHLLGFVGSDKDGRGTGYFGLEGYYNRELSGQDGLISEETDVLGHPILLGSGQRIPPHNGRNLVLYLDKTIQRIAERELSSGIEKYGAKDGTVTIMDPKTGGILALAGFPAYDPTEYAKSDPTLYPNPVVGLSYEPGSTFKTLVMAAAIAEHKITPETNMLEDGPVTVDGYTIRTWNDTYHGPITMTQVLEYSSNVGMVYVERQLGKNKLLQYLSNFGIGQPTGVDLQDETSPDLRPADSWHNIDLATASFGQGIAVTPLQMVRAVAALANNGWIMEPHAVKEIIDDTGKSILVAPKKIRQIIPSEATKQVTKMMVTAVDLGEAKWAKPKGYQIAGKTGTAQIPVAGHYDNTKTIASFVGFAPADDPKFVMLVTLREPTTSPWGSETAAPLFFNIAKDIFRYWGIPPTL